MKNIKWLIILVFFTLVSCESWLDINPEMGLDEEEIYSDYYSYRGVLDRAHWYVKDYYPNPHVMKRDYVPGQLSDECQTVKVTYESRNVNSGDWQSFQTGSWELGIADIGFKEHTAGGNIVHYQSTALSLAKYGVRAANQVVANIDKLKEFPDNTGKSETELKNELLGQGYFLRAWFNFEYMRRLGGTVYMNQVYASDYNFDTKRQTYQQSTDSLVKDLDMAIELLPEAWGDADGGRPTSTSAKALKAMALLYASSPNMNLSYGVDSDPESEDAGYNTEYLERAVSASVEAIKAAEASSSPYSMYEWGDEGEGYQQNWLSKTEKYPASAIFHRMPKGTQITHTVNAGRGSWRLAYDNGYANYEHAPTQNIVDMFETIDGFDINDPNVGSSFDPHNPYENRDPRLKYGVYVNGSQLYLKPDAENSVLEPFIGESGVESGFHYEYMKNKGLSWTGYEIRGKHRWRGQNNVDQLSGYYRTWPFIRFAQLYLDLAEAANELYGPTAPIPGAEGTDWATAEACINKVRSYVDGLSPVRSEYVADKITFRNRIRNERAVELFLEFHRWHDIRRWKIAKEALSSIKGVQIIKKQDGTFDYSSVEFPNARVFEEKHYWYPLSLGVVDMMLTYEQNPGW